MSSEDNFTCFAIACVDIIKLPLIDILTDCINPVNLYNELKKSSSLTTGKNKLLPDQLKKCFLPPPDLPNYKDFDVSLLYTLIRNLCPSLKPTQGWGTEPKITDTQVGDDIERLRLFRNNYYGHADSTKLLDGKFEDLWKKLKSVIQRLQTKKCSTTNYEKELEKIENKRFTSEDREKYKYFLEVTLTLWKHAEGKDDPEVSLRGTNEVICGNTARFELEVKQAEPSNYKVTWQKVKESITEQIETRNEKYIGSSDGQLIINVVCKEDKGDYQAVLLRESNGNTLIVSNKIHLLPLGEKPHFEEWKVTTGSEGITIHYSYGDPEKLPKVQEIKWTKNGAQLDCGGDKYKGGGLNDKSFTITSPAEDDRGTYSCTVRNAVGSETNNVTFDVPDAIIPTISTVCFGSETIFVPEVVSCPLPDGVQWQKSNDNINFKRIDINEAKYYGSRLDPDSPKLVITKTTFEDMFYYRLFIWNKIGERYSNTRHLNVTGRAPHVWTSHEIKENVKTRTLRLIGKVFVDDQSPAIHTIYWTKGEKEIKTLEGGDKYSEGSIEDPSLIIQSVNHHDVGSYQLTAINAVGSNKSNIVLGVPQIFIERSKNLHDDQCFTATVESIPAAFDAFWKVKRNDDDSFTSIDVNAEEYNGTSNSLPCPVLVVKKKELLESQRFCIEVHNFVGSHIQEISAEQHVEIPDTPCRTKDDMSSYIFNKNGLTIRFNNLRQKLIKSLKGKDTHVKELKDSLEVITSERSLFRDINSIEDIFCHLLDEGLLKERNVIIVQYLMRQIDRPDLEEMCFEYATKSKQVLCYHENPSCQDEPRVVLHVNDDIEHFTTMESLLQTVASIVDCTLDDIKIVRLQPDQSFIIIITMRAELLSILKETDPHYLRKLLQFKVDWIRIEDYVVNIVTETCSDSVCDTDGKHKQLPQMFEESSDSPERGENVPSSVGTPKSPFVAVQLEKCAACQKTVYAMEKIEMNKNCYHRACFKCSLCNSRLTAKTFSINEGVIYCTNHFKQLFDKKGNSDRGFRRQKYKKRWQGDQPSEEKLTVPEPTA